MMYVVVNILLFTCGYSLIRLGVSFDEAQTKEKNESKSKRILKRMATLQVNREDP
jgi:hypothetical protein